MTDPSHQPRPPADQPTPPPSYNPPPPGYGAPPPQPPKKSHKLRWGCLSALGALVLVIIIVIAASAASSGGSHNGGQASKPSATPTPAPTHHAASTPTPAPKQQAQPQQTVSFTVSGDDGGAGVDIMYGSDSQHNSPSSVTLPWTITMPYDSKAQYYNVTAQLQGASGSLQCSVTVQGHKKSGSASGAYQICDAQLNNYGFGWQ